MTKRHIRGQTRVLEGKRRLPHRYQMWKCKHVAVKAGRVVLKSTPKIHQELLFTFKKVQMTKGHSQCGDLRAHFSYRKQISQTGLKIFLTV